MPEISQNMRRHVNMKGIKLLSRPSAKVARQQRQANAEASALPAGRQRDKVSTKSRVEKELYLSPSPEVDSDIPYRIQVAVAGLATRQIVQSACGSQSAQALLSPLPQSLEEASWSPASGDSDDSFLAALMAKAGGAACHNQDGPFCMTPQRRASEESWCLCEAEDGELAKVVFTEVPPRGDWPLCSSPVEALSTILVFTLAVSDSVPGEEPGVAVKEQLGALLKLEASLCEQAPSNLKPLRAVLLCGLDDEDPATTQFYSDGYVSLVEEYEKDHGGLWKFGPVCASDKECVHDALSLMLSQLPGVVFDSEDTCCTSCDGSISPAFMVKGIADKVVTTDAVGTECATPLGVSPHSRDVGLMGQKCFGRNASYVSLSDSFDTTPAGRSLDKSCITYRSFEDLECSGAFASSCVAPDSEVGVDVDKPRASTLVEVCSGEHTGKLAVVLLVDSGNRRCKVRFIRNGEVAVLVWDQVKPSCVGTVSQKSESESQSGYQRLAWRTVAAPKEVATAVTLAPNSPIVVVDGSHRGETGHIQFVDSKQKRYRVLLSSGAAAWVGFGEAAASVRIEEALQSM